MLRTRIVVDLPSVEVLRQKTLGEAFRSLFGAKVDLHTGTEEITVTGLALIGALVNAFQLAGMTNAIAFIVDQKVVYKDPADQGNDLPLIMAACQETRLLTRKFGEMHLVVSHAENGMLAIADVHVRRETLQGQAEMVVDLSGRIDELRIARGETAAAYAARVRAFSRTPQVAEAWERAFESLARRLAAALGTSLPGSRIAVEPVRIQLIRPSPKQVGRFRHLKFGAAVERPTYRPVPARERLGAYADPFYFYYFDPYYDFMTWVILDDMARHNYVWSTARLAIVDDAGVDVTEGGAKPPKQVLREVLDEDAVDFSSAGFLLISDDIDDSGGLSLDDLASASDADAWGADADASDGGGDGGSDGGSDGASDGGSDGGSSCGSSCGGGCGGGY
ncbi:MAG: hypothetical protein HYZ29_34495 [Myxococcales bacterium]|nr:hypothetical protein [Myxococcales bacterium]